MMMGHGFSQHGASLHIVDLEVKGKSSRLAVVPRGPVYAKLADNVSTNNRTPIPRHFFLRMSDEAMDEP